MGARQFRAWALPLVAVLATACTGGGSDSDSEEPPERTLSCVSGSGGGINGLQMSGDHVINGLSTSPSTADDFTIKVGRISFDDNSQGPAAHTGSLQIKAWAVTRSYSGGTISGQVIGTKDLSFTDGTTYLFNHQLVDNFQASISGTTPSRGEYCIVLTLSAWDGNAFLIYDWTQFADSYLAW